MLIKSKTQTSFFAVQVYLIKFMKPGDKYFEQANDAYLNFLSMVSISNLGNLLGLGSV